MISFAESLLSLIVLLLFITSAIVAIQSMHVSKDAHAIVTLLASTLQPLQAQAQAQATLAPKFLVSEIEIESVPAFVQFKCSCGIGLSLESVLDPGQVAVINCDNCGMSHSVFLPSIQIHPTEAFEKIWPYTRNDAIDEVETSVA